jgi:hypothetical protein
VPRPGPSEFDAEDATSRRLLAIPLGVKGRPFHITRHEENAMDRTKTSCKTLALATLGLIGAAASCALAQPATLFTDDFQSTAIKPQWKWAKLSSETPFTRFSGRYSNNTIQLLLDAPDGPRDTTSGGGDGGTPLFVRYTLRFDFFAIDSWDGDDTNHGPDRFEINNTREVIFSETFGNAWLTQSFREPDIGRFNMAYGSATDAIYRDITVTFDQPLNTPVHLFWYDRGLQGVSDESWGIDNVYVGYEFVPAPGAAGTIALGCLLAAPRRRRA